MSFLLNPHYFFVVLDFILVFILVYRSLLWLRTIHSFNLIKGFLVFFIVFFISRLLSLTTLNWILDKFATLSLLLIVILFQPELRRFLERIGAATSLFSPLLSKEDSQNTLVIQHILKAIKQFSQSKIGALIVIERTHDLTDYFSSGVMIQGDITESLLVSLFWPGAPTHDGAVIIRANKIEVAGCLLPLSKKVITDRRLGTRHQAALGLSELSDALIIVVSEETGFISLIEHQSIMSQLDLKVIETRLFKLTEPPSPKSHSLLSFFKKFFRRPA